MQAVLSSKEGWRSVFGSNGKRLCCGAVVSCWGEREASSSNVNTIPSVVVCGGTVKSSPHDDVNAAGGVKQHTSVEHLAAAAAAGTAHSSEKAVGNGTSARRPGQFAVCRQWWRSRVDGKQCACDPSRSQGDGDVWREDGIGLCGRRHYFLNSAESDKFELLERKRKGMQEEEERNSVDDPHAREAKQSKSKSDGLFVDWIITTFGTAFLREGGVVDVAGGRGHVAYRLVHHHHIPCTLVRKSVVNPQL